MAVSGEYDQRIGIINSILSGCLFLGKPTRKRDL